MQYLIMARWLIIKYFKEKQGRLLIFLQLILKQIQMVILQASTNVKNPTNTYNKYLKICIVSSPFASVHQNFFSTFLEDLYEKILLVSKIRMQLKSLQKSLLKSKFQKNAFRCTNNKYALKLQFGSSTGTLLDLLLCQ